MQNAKAKPRTAAQWTYVPRVSWLITLLDVTAILVAYVLVNIRVWSDWEMLFATSLWPVSFSLSLSLSLSFSHTPAW